MNQTVYNCLWARASYRTPSNLSGYSLDFNVWGYVEPISSCNQAAPWGYVQSNELGLHAELWNYQTGMFCSDTPYYIIPGGQATPFGYGKAYKRSGNCATGRLTVRAYASPFVQDYTTLRSQITTP